MTKRLQVYIPNELGTKLAEEASRLGISVSLLVSEKLGQIYLNSAKDDAAPPSLLELYEKVEEEVGQYINRRRMDCKKNDAGEFILNDEGVSATFRGIDMTNGHRPAAWRASIGRTFNRQVRDGKIAHVIRALTPSGELKFKYKSAVYQIVKDEQK